MRAKWRSRVLVLGSLGPALMGASDVLANGHFWQGASAAPTAYVVDAVPTSYLVPTSYVPYAPSYVATSYVVSPSFAYVAPRAYRRYMPTRYVQTAVVYPAVFETQAVSNLCDPCAAAPPCCESGSSPAPGSVTLRREAPRSAGRAADPMPSTVESVPAQEPSEPTPAAVAEPTMRRDTSPAPGRPAAVDPNFPTPPDAPAHEKDAGPATTPTPITSTPADVGAAQPKPKTSPQPTPVPAPATPPIAPGAEGSPLDLPPAGEAGQVRHQVQKPAGGKSPYLRSVGKGDLHKLEGKVISSETGQPEEGVRVTIANRGNTYVDRVALSDAFGRYAFTLPDGEWTVNVTMPSGRSYPVSQLNVAGGQINDELGRDIPSLTINR